MDGSFHTGSINPLIEHTLVLSSVPDAFLQLPSVAADTRKRLQRAQRHLAHLATKAPPGHRYRLKMGRRTVSTFDSEKLRIIKLAQCELTLVVKLLMGRMEPR